MSITPHWSEWPTRNRTLDPQGYLYVLEFSMGVVKVGKTVSPRSRAGDHERDVARYGGTMVHWWVSEPHVGFHDKELALIAAGACLGQPLGSPEYFAGCSFDEIVSTATDIVAAPATPLHQPRTGWVADRRRARHRRVGELRATGMSQRQIATALQVSVGTICRDLAEIGDPLVSASA